CIQNRCLARARQSLHNEPRVDSKRGREDDSPNSLRQVGMHGLLHSTSAARTPRLAECWLAAHNRVAWRSGGHQGSLNANSAASCVHLLLVNSCWHRSKKTLAWSCRLAPLAG
ncbi:hypothetical protein PybrP1_009285, partial [[Pythium] brassicae (nom. inval.)]